MDESTSHKGTLARTPFAAPTAVHFKTLLQRLGNSEQWIRSEHRRPRSDPIQVRKLKRLHLRTKDALRDRPSVLGTRPS